MYCLIVTNAIRNTDELLIVGCKLYDEARILFKEEPVRLEPMYEAEWLKEGSNQWKRHFDETYGRIQNALTETLNRNIQELTEALEHGLYNAAPTELTQGEPLAIEGIETTLQRIELNPANVRLTFVHPDTRPTRNIVITNLTDDEET